MNRMDRVAAAAAAAVLVLSLAACQERREMQDDPTEPIVQSPPPTQAETETVSTQFWEDVVELVGPEGESTTVYLLADHRYLDRQDRFFTYDGLDSWTCTDGSVWSRKPDASQQTTNVYAEYAVDRLLAQRPEYHFYSDGTESGYASKILLTFDTTVTNFTFYKLDGTVDEEGNYVCTSMQELYRQPTITENDLTVVETELGELLPIRAISFCDAGGNTRYYYLTLSGKDGAPLLIPFD